MSTQTWTDEQLLEFLAKADSLTSEELSSVSITNSPGRFPFSQRQITLCFQDQKIALSDVQALTFQSWVEKKYPPETEIEHIGDFAVGIVQGGVEIRGRTYEYFEFPAKDALELLTYLYRHKDELEQFERLTKEQSA